MVALSKTEPQTDLKTAQFYFCEPVNYFWFGISGIVPHCLQQKMVLCANKIRLSMLQNLLETYAHNVFETITLIGSQLWNVVVSHELKLQKWIYLSQYVQYFGIQQDPNRSTLMKSVSIVFPKLSFNSFQTFLLSEQQRLVYSLFFHWDLCLEHPELGLVVYRLMRRFETLNCLNWSNADYIVPLELKRSLLHTPPLAIRSFKSIIYLITIK